MKKNEIYDIEITDLTSEGQGVGRADQFVVFVSDTFYGEIVRTKIVKVNKNLAHGIPLEILKPSEFRIKPQCEHYKSCGGCQLQHISYEGELIYKQKKVNDTLKRIGGIDCIPEKILGSESLNQYRNKGQFPVGVNTEGNLISGLYAKRTHRIIPVKNCSIQNDACAIIIRTVMDFMKQNQIPAYDEASHKGCIRHIYTRVSHSENEIMLVIVTATRSLPKADALIRSLLDLGLPIVSIIQNINPNKTNVVLGEKSKTLYGKDYITDTIHGLKFKISHQSFYQVNPLQTEVLYQKVLDFANLSGNETVFDLYCGIGTITLLLAKHAKKVYGIEIVPQAIENAKENAKINQIENVEFKSGDSKDVTQKLLSDGITPDVIVVDPPRSGLDSELIDTIIALKPDKLIYVSCDVGTLARDLKQLSENSYQAVKIQPVDMFPRTKHVECVVMMSRVSN